MSLSITEILKKVSERFPEATIPLVAEKYVRDPEHQIRIPATRLKEVAKALKDDPDLLFDLPNFMTAVDYMKDNIFELVYHVYSTTHKLPLVFKCQISRSDAKVDSLTPVWSGFDFQEREVLDLFGIQFIGHPTPKRILMWEGYPGYPLRKDYIHTTDRYDSGLEIGTPGLDEKGVPSDLKRKPDHG